MVEYYTRELPRNGTAVNEFLFRPQAPPGEPAEKPVEIDPRMKNWSAVRRTSPYKDTAM